MGERHYREDFVSCDWCHKEVSGFRCEKSSNIERVVLGNISRNPKHEDSDELILRHYDIQYLNGISMDLCSDCQKLLFNHVNEFIKTKQEIDSVVRGD